MNNSNNNIEDILNTLGADEIKKRIFFIYDYLHMLTHSGIHSRITCFDNLRIDYKPIENLGLIHGYKEIISMFDKEFPFLKYIVKNQTHYVIEKDIKKTKDLNQKNNSNDKIDLINKIKCIYVDLEKEVSIINKYFINNNICSLKKKDIFIYCKPKELFNNKDEQILTTFSIIYDRHVSKAHKYCSNFLLSFFPELKERIKPVCLIIKPDGPRFIYTTKK